ncbi:MAG: hypothetical protein WDO24_24030 [Pseudomonadota bacterium]
MPRGSSGRARPGADRAHLDRNSAAPRRCTRRGWRKNSASSACWCRPVPGVGSAVGFLLAPVAFEIVRSRFIRLDASFDAGTLTGMLRSLRAEAEAVVRQGAPGAALTEAVTADMRYRGQGHELTVPIPRALVDAPEPTPLIALFEAQYAATFGRTIPGLEVETINWTLRLSATAPPATRCPPALADRPAAPVGQTRLFDPAELRFQDVPVYCGSIWFPDRWCPAPR